MAEALRLWGAVRCPNLMVKVPATPAGIPAIRQLIGSGLNINVTLLFSVSVYEQVVEAYISGLEDLARAGGEVSKIGSVASFFVSRIDSAIDNRLDRLGDKKLADRLRGKAAIANAKLAYVRYKAVFWPALAASGVIRGEDATPALGLYEHQSGLQGHGVCRGAHRSRHRRHIPPATMDAFRDHGTVKPDAIEQDVARARAMLAELEQHGVSLEEVTDELVTDGVRQFADAFDKLLGAVARRRRTLLEGDRARLEIGPGSLEMKAAFEVEMEVWRKEGRIRRLGPAISRCGPARTRTGGSAGCASWSGSWLIPAGLHRFTDDVKQRGFADVVLLGMGG